MFLSSCVLKSLNNIERIQPRMMCATFNSNPSTTIISCYRPTDETNTTTFYNELSFVRHIFKHNVLIIGEGINVQMGKNGNYKFC